MSFEQGHALLIGVGTYANAAKHNVPVTVRDAEAVEEILKDEGICGYPAGQVKVVKEENATSTGVLAEIASLAERTKEESVVFLFFCSHGVHGTDGNWYFTTHDSKFVKHNGKTRVVPETAVGEHALIEQIRVIPANKKFIIFNTCHSGEMSQALSLDDPPPKPELASLNPGQNLTYAILEEGKGNVIITASGSDQLSYFGRSANNTIFAQALINALGGNGVYSNNGYIGAFNLYSAVYEDVEETAQERFGVTQQPELTVLKAVGSMPIALFRGAEAGSLSLDGFQSENDPEDGRVNSVTPKRATRAYTNHFGAGSTQTNIETVQGDFVGGDQVSGDKYSAGGDMNFDQRDIKTEGGAFIGGNVSTGSGSFTGRDSYSIGDVGSNSTVAQGSGSTVVGSGGVNIGGKNSGTVITGDGNVVGDHNTVAGGDINLSGSNPNEIAAAFDTIQQAMASSTANPAMIPVAESSFVALKFEASKGENANEVVVESLMGTLTNMLPDIAEVVITTFLKPVKGLGLVFQKVAQKIRKGS